MSCVLAYTESSEVESVALKAIDLLMICCDHLSSGRVVVDGSEEKKKEGDEEIKIGLDNRGRVRREGEVEEDEDEDVVVIDEKEEDQDVSTPKTPLEKFQFQDSENHRVLWWPALTGLSDLITSPYLEVRFHSMRSLFQVLRRSSNEEKFSKQMWIRIFRHVLFRIFTSVHVFAQQVSTPHTTNKNSFDDDNNLATLRQMAQEDRDSCRLALNEVVKLFSERLDDTNTILEELLLLLRSFVAQPSLDLACIGVDCMKLLLLVTGDKFDRKTWTRVCEELEYLFTKCMPNELIKVLKVFQTKECQDIMSSQSSNKNMTGHHLHSGSRLRRTPSSSTSSNLRGPPPEPPSRTSSESTTSLRKGAKVTTIYGGGVIQSIRADGIAVVTLTTSNTTLYASGGVVLASRAAEKATRNEVVTMLSQGRLPFDELLVFTRCKVQLELLPALTSIVEAHFNRLSFENLEILLNCLRASLNVARRFNRAKRYRVILSEMGFMKHLKLSKLTNLLRQETAAIQLSRTMLFRMASMIYEKESKSADSETVRQSVEVETRLRGHCEELVSRYLECDDSTRVFLANLGNTESPAPGATKRIEEGRMMIAFDVHVVQLVQSLKSLPNELFERYTPWSFGLLIRLIRCQNLDLREVVMDLMKTKVKTLVLKGCAGGSM